MSRGRLLDRAQLADRLGISERMARRLMEQRAIPVVYVGPRHPRVAESDADAYIDASRVEALTGPLARSSRRRAS